MIKRKSDNKSISSYHTSCPLFGKNQDYCWTLPPSGDLLKFAKTMEEKLTICDSCPFFESRTGPDVYVYRTDKNSILFSVSPNWDDFALNNGGEEATAEKVLGKKIWDFISNREVRHIFEQLVKKVFSTGKPACIPINCDSPDTRREMELSLIPLPEEIVEYRCRLVAIKKREPVNLLRKDVERTEELIKMCSYCKAIEITEDEWKPIEEAIKLLGLFDKEPLPVVSHGICKECLVKLYGEI